MQRAPEFVTGKRLGQADPPLLARQLLRGFTSPTAPAAMRSSSAAFSGSPRTAASVFTQRMGVGAATP